MRVVTKPVYTDLVEYIEKQIKSGEFKVNERIPGENDLAARFKISRVSVRKGIKSLIERQFLVSHQGRGAFVTLPSEVRRKKEYSIGLIARPAVAGVEMYLQVQNILCERFFTGNCRVRMLPMPESVDYFLKNNAASGLDYYVWLFPNEDAFPIIKELSLRMNKPFLLFDRSLPGADSRVVSARLDEEFAVRQAVKLLANYGRTDILFIYRMTRQYNVRRIGLFKKAVADNDIELNVDNIVNVGNDPGYAERAAEMVVERRPAALFCAQGAISRDILPHLYRRGIMLPDDLSVITFDRIESLHGGAITCIYSDYERLAVRSAEYVMSRLREPEEEVVLPVVQSDLIMGESCAPL